jgi:DNA-binding MarR family transcriptional regulator
LRKICGLLRIDSWKVNNTDVKSAKQLENVIGGIMGQEARSGGEALLFLTDEQLRKGIEAMFFAYRGFTADPDRILDQHAYGRAHHRAVHFIHRSPGTTVNNLLGILGVTKQSLNRVLRTLIEDGLVESRIGTRDKRERHLFLTEEGATLERKLSDAQRKRMRDAYRVVGPDAVTGFRKVLEAMMEPELRRYFKALKDTET